MTSNSPSPSLGAWLTLDSVFAAELMVRTGFDWAVIDLQHGAIGTDSERPGSLPCRAPAPRPGYGRRRRTTHKRTGHSTWGPMSLSCRRSARPPRHVRRWPSAATPPRGTARGDRFGQHYGRPRTPSTGLPDDRGHVRPGRSRRHLRDARARRDSDRYRRPHVVPGRRRLGCAGRSYFRCRSHHRGGMHPPRPGCRRLRGKSGDDDSLLRKRYPDGLSPPTTKYFTKELEQPWRRRALRMRHRVPGSDIRCRTRSCVERGPPRGEWQHPPRRGPRCYLKRSTRRPGRRARPRRPRFRGRGR